MMESVLKRAHDSPAWKEYAVRNMLEDTYMSGVEFGRYLANLREEWLGFMTYMGHGPKP